MKVLRWILKEIRSIILVTLYFATSFAIFMMLKRLLLAEYGIEFQGLSTALLGALVTAKVVIVLERVPLHKLYQGWPAVTDVVLRSSVYTITVLIVLLIEKAIESRMEHGGFGAAARNILEHPDIQQIWAATLCVGLAFIAYNAFGIVRREIGTEKLAGMFFSRTAPAV